MNKQRIKTIIKNLVFMGKRGFNKHIINSLSTLQKIDYTRKENDEFYFQTRIRISAHITEKALQINTPIYKSFAKNLKQSLKNYKGAETTTITWAKNILRMYEAKYEI